MSIRHFVNTFFFGALLSTAFVANAELSSSAAQRMVDRDCSKIRSYASFAVSPKCDFEVTDVQSAGRDASNVHVFSKGFLYNIKFTAVYQGDTLIEVREGYFTGLSDAIQKGL